MMGKMLSQQSVQRWLRSPWMFLSAGLAGAVIVVLGLLVSFDQGYQDDPFALMRTDSTIGPIEGQSRISHPYSLKPPGNQPSAHDRPPKRTPIDPALVSSPRQVMEGPRGPTFDGRPIRPVRTVNMTVTAYSPDARSCGSQADGITASGYSVWTNGMKLVAADTTQLPFGSILTIPGYDQGQPVPVLDRGGAIEGNRLDVLYPTHEAALQWGVRDLKVTLWAYAD